LTRAVLDTNVIVSGLLWHGTPQTLMIAAFRHKFALISSELMLAELSSVLERPKLSKDLLRNNRTPDAVVTLIRGIAEIAVHLPVPSDVVRDPKDRIVLECAVGGRADVIVSGDQDLLVLERYTNIPIVTPKRLPTSFDPNQTPQRGQPNEPPAPVFTRSSVLAPQS
jgi:putative PIN family toxin of toxin-antitoxin system